MPMATKLDRVVNYHEEFLPIKSHDPLITWSSVITWQTKTIILRYHNAYGQQTWQDGGLFWGAPAHKVTWPFDYVILRNHMTNWNRYISTTTTPIATKLGRVVTYVKGILPKKSHCSWVTYFCEITWQFKTYLHYHNAYNHQTWQGGSQLGGTLTHNVTWFFNYVAFWDHLPN